MDGQVVVEKFIVNPRRFRDRPLDGWSEVGEYHPARRTYVRLGVTPKHLMVKYGDAFGLQDSIARILLKRPDGICEHVIVVYWPLGVGNGESVIYEVEFMRYIIEAVVAVENELDGRQLFLPRSAFKVVTAKDWVDILDPPRVDILKKTMLLSDRWDAGKKWWEEPA